MGNACQLSTHTYRKLVRFQHVFYQTADWSAFTKYIAKSDDLLDYMLYTIRKI